MSDGEVEQGITIEVPDEAHAEALDMYLGELGERPQFYETPIGRKLIEANIEVRSDE